VTVATAADPVASRPRRSGLSRLLGRLGLRWGLLTVLVAGWELVTRSRGNPFFPPPSTIARTIDDQWLGGPASHLFLSPFFVDDLLPSLGRMFTGWLLAGVLGITVGVLVGRSARAMDYLAPVLHFLRAIPPPSLLPVVLVLVRSDTAQLVGLIVFGIVWPVLLNAADGAGSVHPTQRETARAFRISRSRWLFRVVLPAAAPKIFAGLRISLSLALILMVIAEYTSATNGIGYQLQIAQAQFDMPTLWALVVLLGILGYGCNAALLAVQRRALGWQAATGAGA
jgi:ABC-type nitrate/sulfonate/bicarbonate transport system permease component